MTQINKPKFNESDPPQEVLFNATSKRNLTPSEQPYVLAGANERAQIKLTKREIECCHMLVFGYSANYIARKLKISTRTAEHYIDSLKLKLQCKSKYALGEKIREILKISIHKDS